MHLKRKHLCKPYQHGGEAAGYDSPVGCQRYLTRTPVGYDLTSPLSVNTASSQTQNFFKKFCRVVVIECVEGEILELVNPRIVAFAGTQEAQEGCLSIPGEAGITRRPMHVTVRAQDRNGNEVEYSGSDLLARAFCHELDHLDGKLYTDCAIRMLGDND